MYKVGNFVKYLKDHPGVSADHQATLEKVRARADAVELVPGFVAEEVFGKEVASQFASEVTIDPEHMKMFFSSTRAS